EQKQNNNSKRESSPCARKRLNSSSASRKPKAVSARPNQRPIVWLRRKKNDWPNWKPSAGRPQQKRSNEQKQNSDSKRGFRPCEKQRQDSSSAPRKPKLVSAKPR